MESIKLKFPDNSVREFAKGVTGKEVAKSISNSLARDALAIEFNGEVWDLSRKIDTDGTIKILKWEDPGGKYAYWHSSAHLMAESIESLFPMMLSKRYFSRNSWRRKRFSLNSALPSSALSITFFR